MGGQDQGLYVNMSSFYQKEGRTFIKDEIRSDLSDSRKEIYDERNQYYLEVKKQGQYEGGHHLGIYIKDLAKSEYVFQFYPLHPLWMAIFGEAFGNDYRVYSLVFFSILSIINIYLLACEIAGGKKAAAYIIGLFLAVNPLHAFFSKFPTAEIVALFFSSGALYVLIKLYKRSCEGICDYRSLVLSAGLMGCYFFTHINGFLYLPLLFFVWILNLVFKNDRKIGKLFIYYCFGVLFFYALSAWYGVVHSFPYFYDVFKVYFGEDLKVKLLVLGLLLGAVSVAARLLRSKLGRIVRIIIRVSPFLVYLGIFASLSESYQIAFTDKYAADFLYKQWNIAHHGLHSLSFSSPFVFATYISPPGFLLMIIEVYYAWRNHDILATGLSIFLSLFIIVRLFLEEVVPYQYYYARYLLTEVVPYSLLLISILLGSLYSSGVIRIMKIIASVFVFAIVSYFTYHSSFQLSGLEADGSAAALKRVAALADENDIVIDSFKDYQIMTPLKYYFGINYCLLDLGKDAELFDAFVNKYNDVFVLSDKLINNQYSNLLDTIYYKQGVYEHVSRIPHRFFYYKKENLYLYAVSKNEYFSSRKSFFPSRSETSHFYDDNIWSDGKGTLTGLNYRIQPEDKYIVLTTGGHSPLEMDLNKLGISLSINNSKQLFSKKEGNDYYFVINKKTISDINTIGIFSSTFVPKDMKINDDDRELGVEVISLNIR